MSPAARRRRAQDRDPLYQPGAQLAGHDLVRAANALTGIEFGPRIREVNRQARQTRAQGNRLVGRANSYYRELAKGEAARVARQKALGADLDKSLAGIAAETGGQIDRAQQDAAAAMREAEGLRGPGLSGGGDRRTVDELASQRARAAGDAGAYRSQAALESANYGGLVNSLGGATRLHGAETRRELVNRRENALRDLRSERSGLVGQRSAGRLKNLLTLRQSGFDNAVTLRGLGLKEEDIQAKSAATKSAAALSARRQKEVERNNRRQARLAKQRNRTSRRGQTLGHRDRVRGQDIGHQDRVRGQNISRGKGKGKKNEPQSSINTRAAVVTVRGEYERLLRRFGGDHAKTARTIRRRAREAGKQLPEYILVAAADLANFGYVTPGHVRQLRDAGVRVPRKWRRKPKRGHGIRGVKFGL